MVLNNSKFRFAIDRGGTFTDVFAKCPNGKIRVLKLLSEDPQHYSDAPTEGIRRILQEVGVRDIDSYLFKKTFKLFNQFVKAVEKYSLVYSHYAKVYCGLPTVAL